MLTTRPLRDATRLDTTRRNENAAKGRSSVTSASFVVVNVWIWRSYLILFSGVIEIQRWTSSPGCRGKFKLSCPPRGNILFSGETTRSGLARVWLVGRSLPRFILPSAILALITVVRAAIRCCKVLSSFLGPTANSAIEGGGQRQSPFSISFLSSRLGPFEDLLQLVLQLSEPYLPSLLLYSLTSSV